jgi:ABC-type multidrug transport system fused ATPase/permease subunit
MLEATPDAGGAIVEQGEFAKLMAKGGKITKLLQE